MPLNLLITFENNSLTLDHPGDDYSAGGTTLTAIGSPTMPTTQPFAGLRSGYLPNPSQYWYMPSAGIFSIADGSYAFSFYHDAVWPTSEAFNFREIADVSNHLLGRFTGADGTGGFEVNIRVGAFGQITISTGDLGLGIGAYYSCKVEWDEAATTIRIKIYDAVGTQIGSTTVNTSVTAGAWPSTIDRLIFGDASGVNGDWYLDNILLGSTASDPLEDNLDIETYGDYGAAGASIATFDSPILDGEQDNAFTVLDTTGNVNEVLLGSVEGVNSIDVTASLTGSGLGPYTYDNDDVANFTADTAGLAFDSASWTNYLQVATTVDGSFQATIVINPAAGYKVIEAVNPLKDAGHVYEDFVGIPVSTDQVLYESTNNTNNTQSDYFEIEADGTILTNIITGTVHCAYFDSAVTTWKSFDITISEGVISVVVSGLSGSLLGIMHSGLSTDLNEINK